MNVFFKVLERLIENGLWLLRFTTIVPVIFSTLSAFILFYLGSIEILESLQILLHINGDQDRLFSKVMTHVLGGIDAYLIGIVMILFSYGVYELFISKIDIGRTEDTEVQLLKITSLDQLKDKILKVIVMAMVVSFFKRLIELEARTAIDALLLAISILLIASSAYLMKSTSKSRSNLR